MEKKHDRLNGIPYNNYTLKFKRKSVKYLTVISFLLPI